MVGLARIHGFDCLDVRQRSKIDCFPRYTTGPTWSHAMPLTFEYVDQMGYCTHSGRFPGLES